VTNHHGIGVELVPEIDDTPGRRGRLHDEKASNIVFVEVEG
jgi:hypothetical protein